jgi:hypothetical protein
MKELFYYLWTAYLKGLNMNRNNNNAISVTPKELNTNKAVIYVQLLRSCGTLFIYFLFMFNSFGVIKNALLFISRS